MNNNSWITLPGISIARNKRTVSSFDSWLRRGRLCHEYQVDATFGQLSLRLKIPLRKGMLEQTLNASGFGSLQDSQVFNRNYVARIVKDGDTSKIVWRTRYFTETYFGHWTSGDCYAELADEFVSSRAGERREVVEQIADGAIELRKVWLDEFEEALRNFGDSIRTLAASNDKVELGDYMELLDGEINFAYYRSKAEKKLDYDRTRANDEWFKDRYVSGFSFPPVPQVADGFEDFALNFCHSLHSKIQLKHVSNFLAQVIRDKIQEFASISPEELLGYLRANWDEIGPAISLFFTEKVESDW